MARDEAEHEFRELASRIATAANRAVALRSSGDWRVLRHYQRRLGQALPALRAALAAIEGTVPTAEPEAVAAPATNGHAPVESPPAARAAAPTLLIADCYRMLADALGRGEEENIWVP